MIDGRLKLHDRVLTVPAANVYFVARSTRVYLPVLSWTYREPVVPWSHPDAKFRGSKVWIAASKKHVAVKVCGETCHPFCSGRSCQAIELVASR